MFTFTEFVYICLHFFSCLFTFSPQYAYSCLFTFCQLFVYFYWVSCLFTLLRKLSLFTFVYNLSAVCLLFRHNQLFVYNLSAVCLHLFTFCQLFVYFYWVSCLFTLLSQLFVYFTEKTEFVYNLSAVCLLFRHNPLFVYICQLFVYNLSAVCLHLFTFRQLFVYICLHSVSCLFTFTESAVYWENWVCLHFYWVCLHYWENWVSCLS